MHLDEVRESLERALVCHDQCLFASPTVQTIRKQTVAPSRKALIAELLRRGRISWDRDSVRLMYLGENSGLQREWCICGLDETAVLQAARADAVDAGLAPDGVREIQARQRATGNPFGLPEDAGPIRQCNMIFFCEAATRHFFPDLIGAIQAIISALGLDAGVVSRGTAGYELFDLGLRDDARAGVDALCSRLRESRATVVVCESPGAVYALRHLASEPQPFETLHLSEFLARHLKSDAPSWRDTVKIAVTLHDSSLLARYLGVTEAPRDVLRAIPGVELREMRHHGRLAHPSGPGLWFPADEARKAMSDARVAEVAETGASTVVTLGPYARRNLSESAGRHGLQVIDLAQLVAARLEVRTWQQA